MSALNNFLLGRTKNKFNFIIIEKISYQNNLTEEQLNLKINKQREANKRYYLKKQKQKNKKFKESILLSINKN